MSDDEVPPDLELAQDLAFQRRTWKIQRIGWAVMVLFILLALAGFMGEGPKSKAVAGELDEGIRVEYERFSRQNAPQTLRIEVSGLAVQDGKVSLWIDEGYLTNMEIQTLLPEPESVEASPGRHTFEFSAQEGNASFTFLVSPQGIGWHKGVVGVEGVSQVPIRQFVYP